MAKQKKVLFLSVIAALFISLLAACSNSTSEKTNSETESDSSAATRIYHSENGDIEVPSNPKRVAVLAHIYVGNVLELGIKPIAVNEWVKGNKFFEGMLDDVEVVTEDSYEKLLELNPDLIITLSSDKNIKKYSEIAPTVTLTHGTFDYLEQHIEIGKIVGKEEEAKAWVEEWNEKAEAAGQKVKEAIGDNATVTVLEPSGKELYVYGKNFGRGTEVMYQAFDIKAPEKVVQDVFGPGFKAISSEVIPQYAGDYLFVGEDPEAPDNSFMETDVWKEIPAVQEDNVIKFDSQSFWFNDPISLENQMEFIVKQFTQGK